MVAFLYFLEIIIFLLPHGHSFLSEVLRIEEMAKKNRKNGRHCHGRHYQTFYYLCTFPPKIEDVSVALNACFKVNTVLN